eukprot:CAMPEP_0119481990 /NCGR_PEP_ID=MMETSP1344-20130328/10061_1 /TAXON_ID=236787 /ORGANISM="Florenciella parvula, Strain CCMP2471" /LENGTH=359 /DNA_ID=CAMNT_0007516375 /DNA_START=66 /DNA_END=1146 /DNA_ORIENTATION=+
MAAEIVPSADKMKAVYVNEWSAIGAVADSISFGEVPSPAAPKKADVLVSVKAASISGDDVGLMQDTFAGGTASATPKPSAAKPLVGGMDYAGVVLAVGPDCKKLKVGDRVCGIMKRYEAQAGTWAEKTTAPEKDVCKIEDDSISFVDAAAVTMGVFVDQAMIKLALKKLSSGSPRCLVIGASGALGTVLLQLLKKYKGHVTAICSGKNAETVRSMGADEVIDYTTQPFGEQLATAEKYAVVFDLVGGTEVQSEAAPLIERGGMYITAVGRVKGWQFRKLTTCEFMGALCYMMRAGCDCCGKYTWAFAGPYPPLTAEIWKETALESGARAAIAEEVPFAEAPIREAYAAQAHTTQGGGWS